MRQFITDLMNNPGCYMRAPAPIHKGETISEYEELKQDLCEETSQMLTMMNIPHTLHDLVPMIMIEEMK